MLTAAADLDKASCVFSNVREGLEGVVGVHVSCADSNMARRRLSVGVRGASAVDAVEEDVDIRFLILSWRGVEGVIGSFGTACAACLTAMADGPI